MAWTKQQQQAIDAENSSVIVSAAAGSGKTAVLVERLINLLVNPEKNIRADRMIIATFTNDAASELKQRLNAKILSKINEEPDNVYILKQYTLLQNARISTINAFCFDLLRDNITQQGIGSDFTVLDDSIEKILKAESADEVINLWCKKRRADIDFLYNKFCMKNDEMLVNLIMQLDNFLSSVSLRKKWLDDTLAEFNKPLEETVYYKEMISEHRLALKKAVDLAEKNIEMNADIFEESPEENKTVAKTVQQADEDYTRAATAYKVLNEGKDINEIKSVASFCTGYKSVVAVSKGTEHNEQLRELYKQNRTQLKNIICNCFSQVENIEIDLQENKEVFEIVRLLILDFYEILWEHKVSRNSISFDDGERLTLELLVDLDENGEVIQSETAKRQSQCYDIIMIDEYQDSNDKEDLIFKLLSKNCTKDVNGNICYGTNAFLVGDVKQCIYKFRLANPENFINTLNISSPYSEAEYHKNASIKLNKNFRSSPQVIDFVNYIFENIMSPACGAVDYNSDEKLNFGALEYGEHIEDIQCKTEITLVKDSQIDEEADDDVEIIENNEAEATAEKIASMIYGGAKVRLKNGENRTCEASDFCILIRKNKFAKSYISALAKRGINARGEEEKGYLQSREIAILLDVLRVIDNPLLDIPMAAVMLSPMYMFTAENLAVLKSFNKRQNLYLIMENVLQLKNGYLADNVLLEKCRDFMNSIKNFRFQAVTLPTEQLIEKIYDTTDFITVMQLDIDGEKKRANLRAMINYARSYEQSGSGVARSGLSGFIRHIDRLIEYGQDYNQGRVSSSSESFVSIKTIHKSKGLEFPFVFLAETNTRFMYDYPAVLCGTDNKVGFTLINQENVRRYRTSSYINLLNNNKREIISEEARLFYVALTRAKQKLFINLKVNDKTLLKIDKLIANLDYYDGSIEKAACNVEAIADWIWLCLICNKKFKDISELVDLDIDTEKLRFAEINSDDVFDFSLYNEKKDEADILFEEPPLADSEIVKEITDIINFKYNIELSQMPSKLSVTQLSKKLNSQGEYINLSLDRPKFISETKALTGSERGTAIHTFFQYCNFEDAITDIESELWRMVDKGYLTEAEAKEIPYDKVNAFFKSDLYSRMKNADKIIREMKFMVALRELELSQGIMEKFKNSDGMIKGIMDLVIVEGDELVVVDYKSDRGCSTDALTSKYELQLHMYKKALELMTNKKVSECLIYSFEMEKLIKI